ncbi:hypothetical protein D8674_003958 [Pyrus ussuriensis x Pyrus communis]|uniref:Uncharacterized protein n=1 Tax=Pyrus ussuriensis x Pyrus communis TaxID=2448454 RepID=A0A5N5FJ61_9ROSA|nr:hypothetical protein D8674_003958 [Pyrus ussuriensis x Pyrus communis]
MDRELPGSAVVDAPHSILPVYTTATDADDGTKRSCREAAEKVGESQQSAASPVAGAGSAAFLAWRW